MTDAAIRAVVALDEACARGDADTAVVALRALVVDAIEEGHTDQAYTLFERFCDCGDKFHPEMRAHTSMTDLFIAYVDSKANVGRLKDPWTDCTTQDRLAVLRDVVTAVALCVREDHPPGFTFGIDVLRQASYEFMHSKRQRAKALDGYAAEMVAMSESS